MYTFAQNIRISLFIIIVAVAIVEPPLACIVKGYRKGADVYAGRTTNDGIMVLRMRRVFFTDFFLRGIYAAIMTLREQRRRKSSDIETVSKGLSCFFFFYFAVVVADVVISSILVSSIQFHTILLTRSKSEGEYDIFDQVSLEELRKSTKVTKKKNETFSTQCFGREPWIKKCFHRFSMFIYVVGHCVFCIFLPSTHFNDEANFVFCFQFMLLLLCSFGSFVCIFLNFCFFFLLPGKEPKSCLTLFTSLIWDTCK